MHKKKHKGYKLGNGCCFTKERGRGDSFTLGEEDEVEGSYEDQKVSYQYNHEKA